MHLAISYSWLYALKHQRLSFSIEKQSPSPIGRPQEEHGTNKENVVRLNVSIIDVHLRMPFVLFFYITLVQRKSFPVVFCVLLHLNESLWLLSSYLCAVLYASGTKMPHRQSIAKFKVRKITKSWITAWASSPIPVGYGYIVCEQLLLR